jgi:malate synthase
MHRPDLAADALGGVGRIERRMEVVVQPDEIEGGGVSIDGVVNSDFEKVLTREAIAFVADLQRRFNPRREELLAARAERQSRLDAGEKPDFLADTVNIRESDWTVAPLPQDILDRRVEITGPPGRSIAR